MNFHADIENIAKQTLPLLSQEYPTILMRYLAQLQTIQSNKAQHPLFYGCYDWHSAVHSHWQLLRIWRMLRESGEEKAVSTLILSRLAESFENIDGIATEADYLRQNPGWERPYGLAWLLYLCRELRQIGRDPFSKWATHLYLLEAVAAQNILNWIPKLEFPIRGGLHNQTAFSMSLMWDWATFTQQKEVLIRIQKAAIRWYGNDTNAPIGYEPSSADFLSPTLCTIELMGRVLERTRFLGWLNNYLSGLDSPVAKRWLTPVKIVDEKDGRLAHFAGLNLSRAWMLSNLSKALPNSDVRHPLLQQSAKAHLKAGWQHVLSDEYMFSHWVPTFAIFAISSSYWTSLINTPWINLISKLWEF